MAGIGSVGHWMSARAIRPTALGDSVVSGSYLGTLKRLSDSADEPAAIPPTLELLETLSGP